MKNKNTILLLTTLFLLSACNTEVPNNDTIKPKVTLIAFNDNNGMVTSSEADDNVTSRTLSCQHRNVNFIPYVTSQISPLKMLLTVYDQGGVATAKIIVQGGVVSEVSPSDATITRRAARDGLPSHTIIEKSYPRSTPQTAGLLTVNVEPDGTGRIMEGFSIEAMGTDFSSNNNDAPLVKVGSTTALCTERLI